MGNIYVSAYSQEDFSRMYREKKKHPEDTLLKAKKGGYEYYMLQGDSWALRVSGNGPYWIYMGDQEGSKTGTIYQGRKSLFDEDDNEEEEDES